MSDLNLIPCPKCGVQNRVPASKLQQGRQPVCGNCKTPLPATAGPLTVSDSSFAAEVEGSALPVLLDAWAPWCGPCKMIAPMLEQLAGEMAGRVRIAKLNVDENPVTSSRFQIRSIPTLLLFKGGQEVDRIVGVQAKGEIVRRLQQVMG